jgi:hypothetical protein
MAAYDGCSTRPRRTNVEFGMSQSPLFLPSTGRWRAFDVDRMESIYVGIPSTINNLANHSLVRSPPEINNNLIDTLKKKMEAQSNSNEAIVLAYDAKLAD